MNKLEKSCKLHLCSPTIDRTGENFIQYPVGYNISYNIPIIKEMSDQIIKLFHINNFNRKINLCCQGSSGAIISSIISDILIKKDFEVVITHFKKNGEKSHYSGIPSSVVDSFSLIVDDFSSSGDTINNINNTFKKKFDKDVDGICLSHVDYGSILNFSPKYLLFKLK
jgi:hypoxanthine-guanine phosphoribosyltransferase